MRLGHSDTRAFSCASVWGLPVSCRIEVVYSSVTRVVYNGPVKTSVSRQECLSPLEEKIMLHIY